MIIPENIKEETIKKLNISLKCYLIKEFETHGYDNVNTINNAAISNNSKVILETIEKIKLNKEINKEILEILFNHYKEYYDESLIEMFNKY